jgi:hypothetical protein
VDQLQDGQIAIVFAICFVPFRAPPDTHMIRRFFGWQLWRSRYLLKHGATRGSTAIRRTPTRTLATPFTLFGEPRTKEKLSEVTSYPGLTAQSCSRADRVFECVPVKQNMSKPRSDMVKKYWSKNG